MNKESVEELCTKFDIKFKEYLDMPDEILNEFKEIFKKIIENEVIGEKICDTFLIELEKDFGFDNQQYKDDCKKMIDEIINEDENEDEVKIIKESNSQIIARYKHYEVFICYYPELWVVDNPVPVCIANFFVTDLEDSDIKDIHVWSLFDLNGESEMIYLIDNHKSSQDLYNAADTVRDYFSWRIDGLGNNTVGHSISDLFKQYPGDVADMKEKFITN